MGRLVGIMPPKMGSVEGRREISDEFSLRKNEFLARNAQVVGYCIRFLMCC